MVNVKTGQMKTPRMARSGVTPHRVGFFFVYGDAVYRANTRAQVAANAVFYGDMEAIVAVFGNRKSLVRVRNRDGSPVLAVKGPSLKRYPWTVPQTSPRMPDR